MRLKFGWSNTTDLRTTTRIDILGYEWVKGNLGDDQAQWLNWQNMQFLREPGGALYLVGTANTERTGWGSDYAGLFRVNLDALRSGMIKDTIQYVNRRPLRQDNPRMGNLAAGGGAYVSPTGQLIVYSVEHENGGPAEEDKPGSIRMGEFRNYDLDISTSYDACHAWVELYNEANGWIPQQCGDDWCKFYSITFDFTDYAVSDVYDLSKENFDDTTDSVKYRAPTGCTIRLYKDKHSGNYLDLVGDGHTRTIGRLSDLNWTQGSGKVSQITSLDFIGNCPKGTMMVPEQFGLLEAFSSTPGGSCEVISIQKGTYPTFLGSVGTVQKRVIMTAHDGLVTITR